MKQIKMKLTLLLLALSVTVGPANLFAEEPPVEGETEQQSVPAKGGAKNEGLLPEVVIKGGGKSGVESEKPPLDIQIDADEAVLPSVEVEDDILRRQPESMKNPRAGYLETLSNNRVVLPARNRLAKDPVKIFYPLREIMALSPSLSQEIGTGWELVVTDSEGESFRKFAGSSLPPALIQWNGRGEKGEMISTGKTYSIVINYKDTNGQNRNFVGEPFAFDGVIHQEKKGLVITLSAQALFEVSKARGSVDTIGTSGTGLLEESADWIKRNFFSYPLRVEYFSNSQTSAAVRAQAIAKTLSSLLLLPHGEVTFGGTEIGVMEEERAEIIITNR